jgi:chaperonin GroES
MEVTMAQKVKPLHDRMIVKRLAEEKQTKGGLIIPDTAKEKPQQGKVVAVGSGKREDGKVFPLDVKAGDTVLFAKYAGSEFKLDGEEHLVLREDEVLGIVEG